MVNTSRDKKEKYMPVLKQEKKEGSESFPEKKPPPTKIKLLNLARESYEKIKRHSDTKIYILLLLLCYCVRVWGISSPKELMFDEFHVFNNVGKYIRREHFFDLTPTLAFMIQAAIAYIFGYDGKYIAKNVGDGIPNNFPVVQLRMFNCISSCLVVFLTFYFLVKLQVSKLVAIFGALMVLIDSSLTTVSRTMIPEGFQLFLVSVSTVSWIYFRTNLTAENPKMRRFSYKSFYICLGSTSIAFSCQLSAILTLVFITIDGVIASTKLKAIEKVKENNKVKSREVPDSDNKNKTTTKAYKPIQMKSAIMKIWFLSFVVLMMTTILNQMVLSRKGKNDYMLSPEFEKSFMETREFIYDPIPRDVVEGSQVIIVSTKMYSGSLMSHNTNLNPHIPRAQRIWLQKKQTPSSAFQINVAESNKQMGNNGFLTNGTVIYLQHVNTKQYINAESQKTPGLFDEKYGDVLTKGDLVEGDVGEREWAVIISRRDETLKGNAHLTSYNTFFYLYNKKYNCYLDHVNVMGVQIIYCNRKNKGVEWRIIQHKLNIDIFNDKASTNEIGISKIQPMSLAGRIKTTLETRAKYMLWDTSGHPSSSRPYKWPIGTGDAVPIWNSKSNNRLIVILPNLAIVWLTSIFSSLVIFGWVWDGLESVVRSFIPVSEKQTESETKSADTDSIRNTRTYLNSFGVVFGVGWIIHWVPYTFISREMFLFNYSNALWFAVLGFCCSLDAATRKMNNMIKTSVIVLLMSMVLYCWIQTYPVVYGTETTHQKCGEASLLNSWNIPCRKVI
ncbi:hypothetical protein BB559_004286 [Furculomyces boomerangus]|uniref:Dolichyl-phosphate-mannose--protein mannosyltransferase n=2 Tax=Furculomyces boomerangus TaxID=61424 RepID=A0A2T9Y2B6_9FUNG|nr:hypothetical protein BB559_006487 [Furculomyces boomerangus]PVU91134.1 hypothetical protein BB559_004286 [Furculomyces boomerangus]